MLKTGNWIKDWTYSAVFTTGPTRALWLHGQLAGNRVTAGVHLVTLLDGAAVAKLAFLDDSIATCSLDELNIVNNNWLEFSLEKTKTFFEMQKRSFAPKRHFVLPHLVYLTGKFRDLFAVRRCNRFWSTLKICRVEHFQVLLCSEPWCTRASHGKSILLLEISQIVKWQILLRAENWE